MNKNQVDASALENEAPKKINKNLNASKIQGSNVEWLKSENVMDHLIADNLEIVSSKYDEKREPKVQEGLKSLESLTIDGESINPLVILLAKWWEHKPVRKEIKNLIDQEAEAKGYEASDYLQNVLGAQIEKFAEFQTAIDRVKYAKTYFIPRGGIKSSLKTRQMKINGEMYNVPIVKLNELQAQYPDFKDNEKQAKALRKAVIDVSTLIAPVEEL